MCEVRRVKKKSMKIKTILILILLILWLFTCALVREAEIYKQELIERAKGLEIENQKLENTIRGLEKHLPSNRDKPVADIVKIEIINRANEHGVSVQIALDIAKCESQFNPFAKNPNSSASGIFQFTRTTWNEFCTGSVYDYRDNIRCFLKVYPRHPEKWKECDK